MIPIESLLGWPPLPSSPGSAGAGDPCPDPMAAARARISDVLTRLEETRRLVMALHYYEELTLPVIATALGMPLAEIKRIHLETVQMLVQELEPILGRRSAARGRAR